MREVTINPWDYDKSLWVDDNTAGMDDKPDSYVHNHKFIRSDNGFIWDSNTEYYGSSTPPPLTYEEAKRINLTEYLMSGTISDPVLKAKFEA